MPPSMQMFSPVINPAFSEQRKRTILADTMFVLPCAFSSEFCLSAAVSAGALLPGLPGLRDLPVPPAIPGFPDLPVLRGLPERRATSALRERRAILALCAIRDRRGPPGAAADPEIPDVG